MGYTTDDIINSIKIRGLVPTSQKTFEGPQFLVVMNEVLTNLIVPMLMSVRENYFLAPMDTAAVSGQDTYLIHPRAIGMKFKNVYFVPSSNESPRRLTQVELDRIVDYQTPSDFGDPSSFYFQDNNFIVMPTPSQATSGVFRQYIFQRRNTLISPNDCGQITAISGNTVTVNSIPTTFTTLVTYDFVKGRPGFQNLAIDQAPTGISGSNITFASLPTGLALGDYLCLAGQSPIPQIPLDLFPVLSQATVVVVLKALNDLAGSKKADDELTKMGKSALGQVAVRAEDQAKKIVSPLNISGFVFGRYWRW